MVRGTLGEVVSVKTFGRRLPITIDEPPWPLNSAEARRWYSLSYHIVVEARQLLIEIGYKSILECRLETFTRIGIG